MKWFYRSCIAYYKLVRDYYSDWYSDLTGVHNLERMPYAWDYNLDSSVDLEVRYIKRVCKQRIAHCDKRLKWLNKKLNQ